MVRQKAARGAVSAGDGAVRGDGLHLTAAAAFLWTSDRLVNEDPGNLLLTLTMPSVKKNTSSASVPL